MPEKVSNSRFGPTIDILHFCKTQSAKKRKAKQKRQRSGGSCTRYGIEHAKQPRRRKQHKQLGVQVETPNGKQTEETDFFSFLLL